MSENLGNMRIYSMSSGGPSPPLASPILEKLLLEQTQSILYRIHWIYLVLKFIQYEKSIYLYTCRSSFYYGLSIYCRFDYYVNHWQLLIFKKTIMSNTSEGAGCTTAFLLFVFIVEFQWIFWLIAYLISLL